MVWGMGECGSGEKKPGSVTQLPRSPSGRPGFNPRLENKVVKSLGSEARFPGLIPCFAVCLPLTLGPFSHLEGGIMGSPYLGQGEGSCEVRGVNLCEVLTTGLSVSCHFIHKMEMLVLLVPKVAAQIKSKSHYRSAWRS